MDRNVIYLLWAVLCFVTAGFMLYVSRADTSPLYLIMAGGTGVVGVVLLCVYLHMVKLEDQAKEEDISQL